MKPIVLVEDNPDDVELTKLAFQKSNIANPIVVLSDGAEAVDYLIGRGADHVDPPCVVLLDLNLPKVGGLQVLEALRAHRPTRLLPVVILTSSDEEQDVVESYSLGANSYVRKPVDFSDFIEATRVLGMYWTLLNERATDGRVAR